MSEKEILVATLKTAITELDDDCRKAGACSGQDVWNVWETIERRIQDKRGAIFAMIESLARSPCE